MTELLTNVNGLKGTVVVPGDKSISHRSIMMAAVSEGTSHITGFLKAEDCMSTIAIMRQLGVNITETDDKIIVEGVGIKGLHSPRQPLDAGNSGTTIRLLAGLLSGQNFTTILTGDASLQKRPMNRIIKPLEEMGANIRGVNNTMFAPLTIKAVESLKAIRYELPMASAQVKSAIILAALQTSGETTIVEKEITRNHTEVMLEQFGVHLDIEDKVIKVKGGQTLTATDVNVPGDISSAAFFLVAALIVPNSKLTLTNVGMNETRAGIIEVIQNMGGNIHINYHENGLSADITVETSELRPTVIEGDIIPRLIDEIPVIALLATQVNGRMIIRDAEELKVKETDRILAVTTELNKMGANILPTDDGMIINGPTPLHESDVDSYGDHRMGMMLQIAALLVKDGTVTMSEAEAVNVSYPEFFEVVSAISL